MSRGPGPIPNRWLHCPRNSEGLIAERFIAFKTPLKRDFQSQMPVQCTFTPKMLLDLMKRRKQPVGLWIDLTNTNRFYDRQEVLDGGAQYIKLQCRGHGETPSPEQVKSFIGIVEEFSQDHPLDAIGVHCTHGFNRTGFLIVSYMVLQLDCAVDAALVAFATARPPGIYKEDYIKELYRLYGDVNDAPPAPPQPAWCLEYDDGDGEQHQQQHQQQQQQEEQQESIADESTTKGTKRKAGDNESGGGGGSGSKRKRVSYNPNAIFMEGVPNVSLVRDETLISTVQQRVRAMCSSKLSGFAGAQPVSMDMQNISFLREMPYRVSWKADGTRYMMLIHREGEIYFLDRDNSVFAVRGIRFPLLANLDEHVADTLVDGEMVIDKHNGANTPRYLIYDIIYYQNREVRQQRFFPDRLRLIEHELIEARTQAFRQQKLNRASEPFGVRLKQFWDIGQSQALLGPKFTQMLGHEPDGLIYQPSNDPYESGVCPRVLKWKPHHMNSIDFRLVIKKETQVGMLSGTIGHLYVGGMEQPYAQIQLTKELRKLNNRIIECKFDRGWKLMRERTDKSFPNSYETARNVWESIRNPVTDEVLLTLIKKEAYRSDSDRMPPPRPH